MNSFRPMTGLQKMAFAPLLLMVASIILGCNNYEKAKDDMQKDLNQALRMMVMDKTQQKTLMDSAASLKGDMVLTLGKTQKVLSHQLTLAPLFDTSHVSLCLVEEDNKEQFSEQALLSSDTLFWTLSPTGLGDRTIALKAFANPSWLSVLRHSRQHLPLAGVTASMAMFLLLAGRIRRPEEMSKAYNPSPDISSEPVAQPTLDSLSFLRLTPMQQQLMDLFVAAPDNILSKGTICASLWPKKESPEDTLYTFICRMKTTLRQQSDMDIVNKRGGEYQLIRRDKTMN